MKNTKSTKLFMYATEFFAGMSLMAVEQGASRLLAPYFSSSQIIWTIIIGTIMIAMAIGNVWGGKSADKNPDPAILFRRLIIASIWIALIPLVGKYVLMGITAVLAMVLPSNFLVAAAFMSCAVLFVYPLVLLGTVTPCLVKYTTGTLEDNGSTVGWLEALNTIGSIIGTFVPTFVTIPAVGTSLTFIIFAAVLFALSLVYFIGIKKFSKAIVVGVIVIVVSSAFGYNDSFAFWEEDLAYEDESMYNYIQVKEDDYSVILSTNVLFGVQSIYVKNSDLTGMYYDYAMAAPFLAGFSEKDSPKVLIVGMATGTYATQLTRYMPGASISGIEIDAKIAALASEYFNLPDSVEVIVADGRSTLAATDEKWDIIMVDAYQDITIPFQMSSVEFFTEVKNHLTEDGVMVVNLNMWSDTEGSINQYLCDTIDSVFGECATVRVSNGTNMELFARVSDKGDFKADLSKAIPDIENASLNYMMNRVKNEMESYHGTDHILTDDKAPVELLGMKMMDELIGSEIEYYKKIFKEKGFKGLLEELLG